MTKLLGAGSLTGAARQLSLLIILTSIFFPWGVHADRLRIVSHVARPEIFMSSPDEEQAGSLLRVAGVTGSPLILGVGQLIERKGWEFTVRCLPTIVSRYPEAKLLIVGPSQPAESAFRQRLLTLATGLGVSNHIQIIQDNSPAFIRDTYRAATLLTHPSFVESFGMVLLEAMTAGLPIVAHNGTGIPCIVDDGITGYVLDVHDVECYTEKLLVLLANPALRQRMGNEGRRQAATRFSQQEIADQLFSVYAEVLGNRPLPTLPEPGEQPVASLKDTVMNPGPEGRGL